MRSTAELQCASHTLRKERPPDDSYRIFLPRYHFHDDRIVWGLSVTDLRVVRHICSDLLRVICHSFAVSFSLHGFSHTFWTVIFKEAKFEGSLSQLISFSFPSSCDLISGVSSSSLMRVDYHSLLLWIGYPRVYLYLEFFPRWIFLLALSVRAIWQNSSSLLPRQFARYARLHGCGER